MTDISHTADLRSLCAAIASSPIVVAAAPARDFAEWCQGRADIDTVILGWIRSHVPHRAPADLS